MLGSGLACGATPRIATRRISKKKVADIYLRQDRRLADAWVVQAVRGQVKVVLFRDLWHENNGSGPYFWSATRRGRVSNL